MLDTTANRAIEKIRRSLGNEVITALNNPKTVEIMRNADGNIWHECLGKSMSCIGTMTDIQAQSAIKSIAGFFGKEITKTQPVLECELPLDGSRFAGQLPPIVQSATFAIRKKASQIFSLNQYVAANTMTASQKSIIETAVINHKNILIVGGTGSGKTTLVNAIIDEMVNNNPDERVFIIEDTGEIQCKAINHVQYHTSIDVSMTKLLKITLRMRPDRILVGEVRGEEALDLLDAWNTGHPGGIATLHANSCLEGLDRLHSLITRNQSAPKSIEPLIANAVDLIIHISRSDSTRKVKEIRKVIGFEHNKYQTEVV